MKDLAFDEFIRETNYGVNWISYSGQQAACVLTRVRSAYPFKHSPGGARATKIFAAPSINVVAGRAMSQFGPKSCRAASCPQRLSSRSKRQRLTPVLTSDGPLKSINEEAAGAGQRPPGPDLK